MPIVKGSPHPDQIIFCDSDITHYIVNLIDLILADAHSLAEDLSLAALKVLEISIELIECDLFNLQ